MSSAEELVEAAPSVVTVAGLDPTGTVGLLVDTAVFSVLGIHPAAVVSVITAQDTTEFAMAEPVAADLVAEQLRRVMRDLEPMAVKTAMLWSSPVAEAVADVLGQFDCPVVVDPVLVDGRGTRIVDESLIARYTSRLVPGCAALTPNRAEASLLLDTTVETTDQAVSAAMALVELGAGFVVVTGGSGYETVSRGPLFDVVASSAGHQVIERFRNGQFLRGTGDTLSAALAVGIGRGLEPMDALVVAHRVVDEAIAAGLRSAVGSGRASVRFP